MMKKTKEYTEYAAYRDGWLGISIPQEIKRKNPKKQKKLHIAWILGNRDHWLGRDLMATMPNN